MVEDCFILFVLRFRLMFDNALYRAKDQNCPGTTSSIMRKLHLVFISYSVYSTSI